MNGLNLDIHSEEKAVELFAENIMKAGEAFLDRPMERPFIPSWNRVISAVPDILQQLADAVEADHAEFAGAQGQA
jgi:glucosyl-3-phosphoglycerate synthase